MAVIVWCKTSFIGFHRWKDAPDDVTYLRDFHRHVFHVRVGAKVTGLDREIEFHTMKLGLNGYLREMYAEKYFEASCEMIAVDLVKKFGFVSVDVSEDGECGANVWHDPEGE